MKRKDLIKLFKDNGWWVLREGNEHTIMTNGKNIDEVPRHTEINEILAKKIIKRWELKK